MTVCAFCGKQFKGKTKDHVPPRNLFGKQPTGNLITVPACQECNGGSSKDDELLRFLALELGASKHPASRQVSQSVFRSVFDPKQVGFTKYVANLVEPSPLWTPMELNGMQLGTMKFPMKRLKKTLHKIVKGLFYHERKHPLPSDYVIEAYLLDDLLQDLPEDKREGLVSQTLPALKAKGTRNISNGVFKYRIDFFDESDPNVMTCLFEFYNRFTFFGFTDKVPASST